MAVCVCLRVYVCMCVRVQVLFVKSKKFLKFLHNVVYGYFMRIVYDDKKWRMFGSLSGISRSRR